MSRWPALLVACVLVLGAMPGCATDDTGSDPGVEPRIAPPLIGTEGVLKAGVDLDTPPWGGIDEGREAGIDIDVAEALAARLGLKLELVDVSPDEAAEALEEGRVDVVFSVPYTADYLSSVATAGSYLADGPAFFVSSEATGTAVEHVTLETLGGRRPGTQAGSVAYWRLASDFGEDWAHEYPTLRAAFEALDAGEVELVAGSAIVGAYLARDFEDIRFAGQMGVAYPVGIVVSTTAVDLADAVREALDELAADGVLEAVRTKWVGDLATLTVSEEPDDVDGQTEEEDAEQDGQ